MLIGKSAGAILFETIVIKLPVLRPDLFSFMKTLHSASTQLESILLIDEPIKIIWSEVSNASSICFIYSALPNFGRLISDKGQLFAFKFQVNN